MPINQFNFKPKGFGINQETTGTVKTGSGNHYNDYYYRSPEYDRLTGGIGAGNSSYGLRIQLMLIVLTLIENFMKELLVN